MICSEMIYLGIEISSGSRPLVYAGIDRDLNILLLENYSFSEVLSHWQGKKSIMLAVNASFKNKPTSNDNETRVFDILEKEITQAGFQPYLSNHACRQWVETYPGDCFDSLSGQTLLPHDTMRGRVQRAEILHQQGLRINATRASFEGAPDTVVNNMRTEFYTAAELDALLAASVAWMLINRPVNIDLTRAPDQQMISIPREEKARRKRKQVLIR